MILKQSVVAVRFTLLLFKWLGFTIILLHSLDQSKVNPKPVVTRLRILSRVSCRVLIGSFVIGRSDTLVWVLRHSFENCSMEKSWKNYSPFVFQNPFVQHFCLQWYSLRYLKNYNENRHQITFLSTKHCLWNMSVSWQTDWITLPGIAFHRES